jgi:hypothetical protein
MKNTIMFLLAFVATLNFSIAQNAPKSTAEVAENDVVKVTYGAPSKRDREIFGKLVPFGEVWRTGANNGTEITFKKDVTFGGKAVKAGTYTLFTIPGQKEWKVLLNSELKQWGSYGYAKIKDKNVAEVSVPATMTENTVEKFNISATATGITIAWDKTAVSVAIQ